MSSSCQGATDWYIVEQETTYPPPVRMRLKGLKAMGK